MKKLLVVLTLIFSLIICPVSSIAGYNWIDDDYTLDSFKEIAPGYAEIMDEFGDTDERIVPDLSESIVTVRTVGTGSGIYPHNDGTTELLEGTFAIQGSGFVIKEGYIVTAAHCVLPDAVCLMAPNNSYYNASIITALISESKKTIFISSDWDNIEGSIIAHIKYVDPKADIALLQYHGNYFKPLPYKLLRMTGYDEMMGYPYDILEVGDAVSVWVREVIDREVVGNRWQLNNGKVISPKPIAPKGLEHLVPWLEPEDITLSVRFYGGCSGSPIFAFMNGKPYIIGVVVSVIGADMFGGIRQNAHFYGTKIDPIVNIMKALD